MPAFVLVGGDNILFPATRAIGTLTTWELWGNYIRYIEPEQLRQAELSAFVKTLPLIVTTFRKGSSAWLWEYGKGTDRT